MKHLYLLNSWGLEYGHCVLEGLNSCKSSTGDQ